ncbi:2-oxo acid dehydrogenase subunit E2 [Nocardioides agariphilus]|uniref:Dihydrolipoamide acetyltransferase component of pyruvate dehydrogenase complex n=1 Tax=Nocardioides agariphilus TaxID=433664 RepID=A0A930VL54_9ACTN|nr:2-oxo acid dehydrogenase subunit E2 [Nocardioides agariphilus]MBF4766745.1 2-oxo acid dehydrogenase subunit E2 [Nocardioides agariphilus]
MAAFTMPSLGADMEEGTLLEWLVHPGDTVHKGDIVAVVDTAKAAIEVETFLAGVVSELLVEPGTVVPVGAPLATIETEDEAPQQLPRAAPPMEKHQEAAVPPPAPLPQVHSPLVRRLSREHDVDLAQLQGTGRGGAITRDDVMAAVARTAGPETVDATRPPTQAVRATPYARKLATELGVDLTGLRHPDGTPVTAEDVRAAAAAPVEKEPVETQLVETQVRTAPPREDRMRSAIAALMARSKREIPHYYLSTTVDMSHAVGWMHDRNRSLSIAERLVPAALLLKATALAATEVPDLNGYWVDDSFQPASEVNVGMAVSLRGGGLVTPALLDVGSLELGEVMARMKDLVTRARGGRLRGRELTEGTLTVTNLGEQGVEAVYGVIYPPQVALVGFGRVADRPWAIDGLLGVRPVTTVTLSADHRASDAMTGARLLAAIDRHLQHPEEL